MSQFALPLRSGMGPDRIVVGEANKAALAALSAPDNWPFGTAILRGPPRSGKSLLAQYFAALGHGGSAIDDADRMDETALFHHWNEAQERAQPLLLIAQDGPWKMSLPDLRSRLGAALHLEIGAPDDELVAALIEAHAAQRGLALGEGALVYLTPRIERSYAAIERLVDEIDRLSLERKQAATMSIWRDGLAAVMGADQPRLL